ncbi:MAG TPA: SRPBCC domain-containing protein [Myxococcaceae bacterium]|nr:SRPBCC domain-containing protein [Myxococcaceae bacterium]
MATESIEVSGVVHAPAERIYQAWLSSSEHTAMTGSRATVEGNVGGRFTCYDGRIEGANLELEPGRRIVQRWRSTDFPAEAADSLLEVRLEPLDTGTRVAFVHSEIPEGQGTLLEEGWRKYYLEPMDRYFASTSMTFRFGEEAFEAEIPAPEPTKPKPAVKKAAPKKAAGKAKRKAKPKRAAKKAAPRRAKKAKAARRSARKGGAKKAKGKGKAKRSSRRGKR